MEAGRAYYLLLRRAEGRPGAGIWESLEAHPRDGEVTARAAVRILLQETSLEPLGLWTVDRVETEFDPATDLIRFKPVFAALVTGETRTSDAYDSARWLSEKEAANMLSTDTARISLEAIQRDICLPLGRNAEPAGRLRIV